MVDWAISDVWGSQGTLAKQDAVWQTVLLQPQPCLEAGGFSKGFMSCALISSGELLE